jgi:Holliday junction resolvase RusA-like endonuclease
MGKIVVELENYMTEVVVSKARRAVYYERGDRIPKKYNNQSEYKFKPFTVTVDKKRRRRDYLFNIKTGERVIKNKRVAGTPSVLSINGQKIWNGQVARFDRNKIMIALKEYFTRNLPKVSFSKRVSICYRFVSPMSKNNSDWDLDNHASPYVKSFQDAIVDAGWIPDDSTWYISKFSVEHVPSEESKLIITVTDEN